MLSTQIMNFKIFGSTCQTLSYADLEPQNFPEAELLAKHSSIFEICLVQLSARSSGWIQSCDPKCPKIWPKKYVRIFANLSPAENNIALETANHPSLQAIYLNIARSARPQRSFTVEDVTKFNIFMNFQNFGIMSKLEVRSNFLPRIFWKLSCSES